MPLNLIRHKILIDNLRAAVRCLRTVFCGFFHSKSEHSSRLSLKMDDPVANIIDWTPLELETLSDIQRDICEFKAIWHS